MNTKKKKKIKQKNKIEKKKLKKTKYDEDTTVTPDSAKDSKEVLHSVTYRPPSTGGPQTHHSHHQHHKSTTCLGGCTDRKGSTVSIISI